MGWGKGAPDSRMRELLILKLFCGGVLTLGRLRRGAGMSSHTRPESLIQNSELGKCFRSPNSTCSGAWSWQVSDSFASTCCLVNAAEHLSPFS